MIIDAFQLFTTEILARHMPSPMKQSIPTFLTKFMHITDRDWSGMYEMCIWDVLIYISLRVLEILTCSYLAWVACLVILTPCNIRDTHKRHVVFVGCNKYCHLWLYQFMEKRTCQSFLYRMSSQNLPIKNQIDQILCLI